MTQNTGPSEPTPQEIEELLQLLNDFGRTKLSLNSLMMRPIWHDSLLRELQEAGLNTEEGHDSSEGHWMHLFYRLGRIFQSKSLQNKSEATSINMRCLAERFGVPLSTATRIVDQMVQRGLLERHSDAQDRRVVLIRLSESGAQALSIIDHSIHERMKIILGHFDPQERQQILSLGARLFEMWTASLQANEEADVDSQPKKTPKSSKTHKGEVQP